MITIEEFNRIKNAALMSLNEYKIRTDYLALGVVLPKDNEVFWASVHKAITGSTGLPDELRRKSKAYLDARGLKSFDDGDL